MSYFVKELLSKLEKPSTRLQGLKKIQTTKTEDSFIWCIISSVLHKYRFRDFHPRVEQRFRCQRPSTMFTLAAKKTPPILTRSRSTSHSATPVPRPPFTARSIHRTIYKPFIKKDSNQQKPTAKYNAIHTYFAPLRLALPQHLFLSLCSLLALFS